MSSKDEVSCAVCDGTEPFGEHAKRCPLHPDVRPSSLRSPRELLALILQHHDGNLRSYISSGLIDEVRRSLAATTGETPDFMRQQRDEALAAAAPAALQAMKFRGVLQQIASFTTCECSCAACAKRMAREALEAEQAKAPANLNVECGGCGQRYEAMKGHVCPATSPVKTTTALPDRIMKEPQ